MNARDRLRRYLEQRREMGETELVLDSMSVEDLMRLLGADASDAGAVRSDVARPSASVQPPLPSQRVADALPPPPSDPPAEAGTADWRAVLRESDPRAAAERPAVTASPADIPAGAPIEVSAPIAPGFGVSDLDSLDAIAAAVATCTRCPLSSTALNPVPGEGSPTAGLMIVGEAPGATEDETGRPFIGAAGQLLTKIIGAINLSREEVFIANVLKHRPPGNRNPLPEEVAVCSPYLVRQIELIRPRVILALGTFAAQTLLQTKLPIGKLRGLVHRYHGVPLIVTYHPAALLRNPAWKRPTWEDVQLARRVLDSAVADGA